VDGNYELEIVTTKYAFPTGDLPIIELDFENLYRWNSKSIYPSSNSRKPLPDSDH